MLKPLQDKILCDNYICDQGHTFLVDSKAAIPSECPFCVSNKKYVDNGLICGDCDIYGIGYDDGHRVGYKDCFVKLKGKI